MIDNLELDWLERVVQEYVILGDTSVFMNPEAQTFFFKYLSPLLHRNSKQLIIPHVVVKELENNMNKPQSQGRDLAKKGYHILKELYDKNLIDFRGESSDTHPDQVFRRIYAQHGVHKNLAFLTNDKRLAEELCNMHNSGSIKTSHSLLIIGILTNGLPYKICQDGVMRDASWSKKKKMISQDKIIDVNKLSTSVIKINKVPAIGDMVYLRDGKPIKLTGELSSGGEGIVYQTDAPGLLAKIYSKDRLTEEIKLKIEQMSQINIKAKPNKFKIAWPQKPVYNEEGKFVGFIMEQVKGKTLQDLCFVPKVAEVNRLSRKDLVLITLNILKALQYIHMKGITVGDINPRNILIDIHNNFVVGLIDVDSYQFSNFNCKVGTPEFTRPVLLRQNVNFNSYKRTPEDEAFAVAVLIFRILMLGKHPYSYRGGEDIIENMKNGNFPYKLKDQETSPEEVPVGPWKAIWSHIYPGVRETLGKVLTEKESISNFKDLVNYENELIKVLNKYLQFIDAGINTNELIPKYIRLPENLEKVRVKCVDCGYEFEMAKDFYNKISSKGLKPRCIVHIQQRMLQKNIYPSQYVNQKSNYTFHNQIPSSPSSHSTSQSTGKEESILFKIFRMIFG